MKQDTTNLELLTTQRRGPRTKLISFNHTPTIKAAAEQQAATNETKSDLASSSIASKGQNTVLNPTLTPIGRYTSTQYDFDLDPRFILHVTNAKTLAAAKERVAFFLSRLREEEAKGKAARFLYPHDSMRAPLGLLLLNRAVDHVGCWLSFKSEEDRKTAYGEQA